VKVVFFDLFLFATGYKVGPQFFKGLGRSALPQVVLTIVLCVTALVTALLAAKVFDYDTGTAAGLVAGAFTESTVIGTAGDAISRLRLPETEITRLLNNIPVAYAVTYLIGTGAAAWFLSHLGPRILGVDLKAEGKKLEQLLSAGPKEESGIRSAYREWDVRAYRLADAWFGRKVAELERSFANDRVFVQRIHRGGDLLKAEPNTVLAAGDTVALSARRRVLVGGAMLGPEIEDRELLDFPISALDVVLTKS